MKLSNFAAYVKQAWKNKPDTSTPLSAERLRHIEDGIKGNSDAIEAIAAAVVNQIVNDPDKIASMAALYAVNQKVSALDGKVGDTAQLPDGATDVVTAIAKQNSDLIKKQNALKAPLYLINENLSDWNTIAQVGWYSGAGASNAPNNSGGWINAIALASNMSQEYFTLFAIDTGTNKLYLRCRDKTGWLDWLAIN